MRVDNVFRAIGTFAVKFRWPILILWIVAAAVIPKALPSLASATQGNNSAFLPASAPSNQASNLQAPLGNGGNNLVPVTVVVARTTAPLTTADQAWLGTLQGDLAKVATTVKVRDLGDSAPVAGVTGQATTLQVLSDVKQGGSNSTAVEDYVDSLRSAITQAGTPPGLQVHLAGPTVVNVDQQKQSGNTGNSVQLVSIVLILILLVIFYRALLAPFLTLIPAAVSVAIAGPLVGEAAQHGLKVSFLVQILLIVLVLGAGTDYGLFLVFRVREQMRLGETPKEAVVSALTKVGESITFSALTVIAALLSLLFATFEIYSNLGIPLAIGIGVMLLAGLTLTPALLAIFGRVAFWPSKNRAGESTAGLWGKIATRVVKRPAVALTIGIVIFGALSAFVTSYVAGGFGGSTSAPAGSDSAAGTALLTKYFPSTSANPTYLIYQLPTPVWEDPAVLVTAEQQLQRSGLFTGITGPLNPVGSAVTLTPSQYSGLHAAVTAVTGNGVLPPAEPPALTARVPAQAYQLYRSITQFVSPDGKTIQFVVGLTAGDPSTTPAMNAVPAIRAETATIATTLHATANGVNGEAPAFYDVSTTSDNDLLTVIPIAIVVIGVLLALVMRSLIAPLYLIASVAISYFASLGLAVLIFIKIGHTAGITFILPFLLFVFLLALGEDYNILVMTRIREEARKMPLREAVSRAIGVTGTTVTSAGLVLAVTFAVFAVVGSKGPGGDQIRDVGIGLTLGILMDTFVVRTILVPCTCVLLGRWNWWPSKVTVESAEADTVDASADALGLADMTPSENGEEVSPSVAPDGKHSLD